MRRFSKYTFLLIICFCLACANNHIEFVHIGTTNATSETQTNKIDKPTAPVTIQEEPILKPITTATERSDDMGNLLFWGNYGKIMVLGWGCLLAILGCAVLTWGITQFIKSKLAFIPGVFMSIIVATLIVGLRSLLSVIGLWHIAYGQIILDQVFALLLAHFAHNLIARIFVKNPVLGTIGSIPQGVINDIKKQ